MFSNFSRDELGEGPVMVSHDPDYGWIVEIPIKGLQGQTEYEFASNHLSHTQSMDENCYFDRRKQDAVAEAQAIGKHFDIKVEIIARYRENRKAQINAITKVHQAARANGALNLTAAEVLAISKNLPASIVRRRS